MKKFGIYFVSLFIIFNIFIGNLTMGKSIVGTSAVTTKNLVTPTVITTQSPTEVLTESPIEVPVLTPTVVPVIKPTIEAKKYSYLKTNKKLTLTSKGAILIDINNGETVYGKNINVKFYPASTTKILTAIIVIESGKLDRYLTVGSKPPSVEPSKIYVKKGEKIRVRELLYALMLESANDAALVLAEGIGGSQGGFAKLMNKKAKSLGCKNSNFVNPNGLPNPAHYTTAYDLSIITTYAMKNKEFKKIIGTKYYNMHKTNKSKARSLKNHNKMMFANSGFYYKGCFGGKTGYTNAARYTHVSIASRNNRTLIAVVLKDTKYAYYDLIKMLDYGFSTKIVVNK